MLTPDYTHLIFGPPRSTISLFTFWMETKWATGGQTCSRKLSHDHGFGSPGKKMGIWKNAHKNCKYFDTFCAIHAVEPCLILMTYPGGKHRS